MAAALCVSVLHTSYFRRRGAQLLPRTPPAERDAEQRNGQSPSSARTCTLVSKTARAGLFRVLRLRMRDAVFRTEILVRLTYTNLGILSARGRRSARSSPEPQAGLFPALRSLCLREPGRRIMPPGTARATENSTIPSSMDSSRVLATRRATRARHPPIVELEP